MRRLRLGSVLSLVRQTLSVGREFGLHSLEAMLWVAQSIEASVYVTGSLARSDSGLSFVLANPPLRMGAFSSFRIWVNRVEVSPTDLRFRSGEASPWRTAAEVGPAAPLEMRPGEPTEVALDRVSATGDGSVTVRLELRSVAIPPLVWMEFTDAPRPGAAP